MKLYTLRMIKLQSWTKYLEKFVESKQNWTRADNFCNRFCVIFGRYYKSLILGKKTEH